MDEQADPYRIRSHVPDFDAQVAWYCEASRRTRLNRCSRLDVAYGEDPAERLDLFLPDGPGPHPVHIFVHGGYWRAFSRKDYSFVADAVVAAGAIAAIVDYALMPDARMERLVAQLRRAAGWLRANAPRFGGDAERISASGHSAGAHLACYLSARGPREPELSSPPVASLLLVSGLYDLRPIGRSFLQPELRLTADEIADWSPANAAWQAGVFPMLAVGDRETPVFAEQACALGRGRLERVRGEDHMSIVRSLGTPGTAMAGLLAQCIAAA